MSIDNSADSFEGSIDVLNNDVSLLLEDARRQAARSVNAVMTATYWQIGRRLVEFEQSGAARAGYGERILVRLAELLTARFGRGFGVDNLQRMRAFYLLFPLEQIYATLSRISAPTSQPLSPESQSAKTPQTLTGESLVSDNSQTSSFKSEHDSSIEKICSSATRPDKVELSLRTLATALPLSWSHYVRLLSVKDEFARRFYEEEARRGGWSKRQLDRQIGSLFYERTALSKNRAAMLSMGSQPKPGDAVSAEEEIKSPYVLEFLGLKDEYSEADLEEALIRHLETFLLELGNDFTFVARQKRIRVGDAWYRIDLLLFHRRLRCLVIIDLKIGSFDHSDAGQMNLYVNYAAKHLTLPAENPPVGLVLCSEADAAVAHYALSGMLNTVLAAEYQMVLPDPARLEAELAATRRQLQSIERDATG